MKVFKKFVFIQKDMKEEKNNQNVNLAWMLRANIEQLIVTMLGIH